MPAVRWQHQIRASVESLPTTTQGRQRTKEPLVTAKGPGSKGSGSKQRLVPSPLVLKTPCLTLRQASCPSASQGMHLAEQETLNVFCLKEQDPSFAPPRKNQMCGSPGLCMLCAALLATKLLVLCIGESQGPGPFGRSGIGPCPVRVRNRSKSRQQSVNMV